MTNLVQLLRTRRDPTTVQRSVGSFSDLANWFLFNGQAHGVPVNTTMPGHKQEDIANSFPGYDAAWRSSSILFGLVLARMQVFSQAVFKGRRLSTGEVFGDQWLVPLERPWPGGTTLDLLGRVLLHADLAGNSYTARVAGTNRLRLLRPDWVSILVGSDTDPDAPSDQLDATVLGYLYQPGGKTSKQRPELLLPEEVAHFAPMPDPQALFRGMSWITPVVREVKADNAATDHKLKFFENAATPNLSISLDASLAPEKFTEWVDTMDEAHKGSMNAYKTLYLGAGADVTVVGADLKQLDFKVTQGAGETRIALAAGVHPVVAGLSEGMQGSSLNAGNYQAAKRQFSDRTLQHLWRHAAASFQPLVKVPPSAELFMDGSAIPFLQDDQKDQAEIQQAQAVAIRQLTDGGYDAQSVVDAITTNDLTKLTHTGLLPVQVQPPGSASSENGNGSRALPAASRE